MTRPTAPDGTPLPRKHVAHFLDTVRWAGCTLHDEGGRLVVRGDRADASYPFRKWIDAGLQPSASSDAPVCTIDPFHGLYALTARRTVHGTARGLDQRVSMAEAIHCYTYNAAYSAFAEGDLGRLVPGQLADIAVYSQDLFAAEPEAMRDETKCDLTILGGKVVYDRQGETGGAISAAE